jgi:tartrate dehydratase alpha subunit/fumarate hydratase class I-like protein
MLEFLAGKVGRVEKRRVTDVLYELVQSNAGQPCPPGVCQAMGVSRSGYLACSQAARA